MRWLKMISLASFQRCTAAGAFGRLEFSLLFAFWSLVTSLQSQLVYAWSVRGASTVIAVHKRWINSNGWDLFEDSPKSKTLDVLIIFFLKINRCTIQEYKIRFLSDMWCFRRCFFSLFETHSDIEHTPRSPCIVLRWLLLDSHSFLVVKVYTIVCQVSAYWCRDPPPQKTDTQSTAPFVGHISLTAGGEESHSYKKKWKKAARATMMLVIFV